jgi:hypothetical protein
MLRDSKLTTSIVAPFPQRVFDIVPRLRQISRNGFGVISLLLGLVFCSTVPVLQFLALGYLLRSAGDVVRSGRLRKAFPGLQLAARIGSFVVTAWLLLFLLSILAGLARDAELIDAGSSSARWLFAMTLGAGVVITAQIAVAFIRGMDWTSIFRPLSNLKWLWRNGLRWTWHRQQIAAGVKTLRSLHLIELLRLGVLAYLGSLIWLLPPSLLLVGGQREGLFRVLGIALLAYSVTTLPVIQTRFAADPRWRVFIELSAARQLQGRVPLAVFLFTFLWLALGLIPYVLLIESFPYGLLWIPSLVFVLTTLPPRLGMAWTMGRALRRDRPAGPWFRWPCALLAYAAGLIFSTLIFFSPYVVFRGSWILLDHPAFLFPILK